MLSSSSRVFALLLTSTALVACGKTQMTLEAPVSSSTSVPIEQKQKVITMGDVTITRTKGGAVKKLSGSAGPWGGEKITQEFEYETSDGWKGSCAFSNGGQSIAGFEIAASGGLSCTLTQGDATWDLAMTATNNSGKRLEGTLSGGDQSIDVKLSREVDKGLARFVGYNYRVGGGAVAAIQTASPRQLWQVDGADASVSGAIKASVGALVFSQRAVADAVSGM